VTEQKDLTRKDELPDELLYLCVFSSDGHAMKRRTFLGISAVSLGTLASLRNTTFELEVSSFKIPLKGLPKDFDSYRIGYISDLHLGNFVPLDWIAHCFDALTKLQPDLIIVGGDLVDAPKGTAHRLRKWKSKHSPNTDIARQLYYNVSTIMAKQRPKDGVIAVVGNHDNWFPASIWQQPLRERGVTLLVNQKHVIQRGTSTLSIYGTDDYLTGSPRIPLDSSENVQIVVSHNPDLIGELFQSATHTPLFELALCGHTHGGQVCLPAIGSLTYNVKHTQLAKGLSRQGETAIFTSRGVGVVELPVRVNCPAEVSILELTCP
jgi:uncharacterized protein